MDLDDTSFENIADTEDDILDPEQANRFEDAIFSGQDPDFQASTEDYDDEI